MSVSILGTNYEIVYKDYDQDKVFQEGSAGYCDFANKHIVIGLLRSFPVHKDSTPQQCLFYEKSGLRHEIVHAFLYESGLDMDSLKGEDGWARNEEMVAWIALQGVKLHQAWEEAGAI